MRGVSDDESQPSDGFHLKQPVNESIGSLVDFTQAMRVERIQVSGSCSEKGKRKEDWRLITQLVKIKASISYEMIEKANNDGERNEETRDY